MKIVGVANLKGGVGKTTVTMQLGAWMSRRWRVLVVDVDPQASTMWWADNVGARLPFDFAATESPMVLARLARLHPAYDVAIIDTPAGSRQGKMVETALDVADYVVIPMTPEPLAVDSTLRLIDRSVAPRQLRYAVMLNRVDPSLPSQIDTWRELLDTTFGVPRLDAYLRRYKAQSDAPVLGELVTTVGDNRRTRGLISDVTTLGAEVTRELADAGEW
ncbi:MAG: ParA family protein [Microbacterium sp.]|uniref:ParA family protein n=1 Tax=Microbacterium sp. TaxID=51671 RepID=UPI003F7EDA1B